MTKIVKVGEVSLPIKYGFNALRMFTEMTGTDLSSLESMTTISLDKGIKLLWCGLKDGARAEKKEFNLTVEDVADLLDEEPNLLVEAVSVLAASFSQKSVGKPQPSPQR